MYSLPRAKIFRGKMDFQKVYGEGRSWANRYLVLYVLFDRDLSGKVGFAAGKKLGAAPKRNRVKRLLREAYRLHQHEIEEDARLILVGRSPLLCAKRQEAEKAFLDLAWRAGILKTCPQLGEACGLASYKFHDRTGGQSA